MNLFRHHVACLFGITLLSTSAQAADGLAWPPITSEARPWVWWWWHGSAVDETNISQELQRFSDAGLGGAQITAIYGTKGAESREIEYLSPRWLQMMGYTVDEAHRLGLGIDMTLGSGWCFGGPTVSTNDANASVVVKTYTVAPGGRIEGKADRDNTQALVAFGPDNKVIDLSFSASADGDVDWIAPAISTNPWTVYAITQKPSGQKVKRPGPGGEGWMLNPAYAQAMRAWLPWFDQALTNYSGSKPHGVFQDSYEYRTDWAPDFFDQFEELRGYKLQNELPALFADDFHLNAPGVQRFHDSNHIGRVKYDYRRTLSDIMVQQSEPVWIDWAHKNGFQAIYQAHGTPGNWLDLYGLADIPETEMFRNDRSILVSKFASSAAHTQGRKLTGAETATWIKEHFTETLGDLKYIADDMFLSGINHIYFHGYCYSPDDAAWPGWLFYASTEMNSRNPIWHDVRALNDYIARCQAVLQSGKPDNDILLYWPVADFWSDPAGGVQPMAVGRVAWLETQPIGKVAHELWDKGYSFDYVSDAQLLQAKVVDKKVQMPGGDYKIVVVPECKYMPLETLKQLIALADSGATVIFEKKPGDTPGWSDYSNQHATLQKLLDEMQPGYSEDNVGVVRRGPGQIMLGETVAALLLADVPRERMAMDSGLSFIRRLSGDHWDYFVANRSGSNFDGWVTLARSAQSVGVLDPVSGTTCVAASRPGAGNSTAVRLQLAPGRSVILRAFADKKVEGPAFTCWQSKGIPSEITGNWNVEFVAGGPTLPAAFQTTKLASWTTFPDTNFQSFAGTAKYEITFDAPQGGGENFELNLGDVRQSARVKLNGKDYGTFITPPFRVAVDNLKQKGNTLEVEVTSVAANRIRDLDRRNVEWRIFKDINFVNVDYRPFNAANWPLTDCGLLGPVTLAPVSK